MFPLFSHYDGLQASFLDYIRHDRAKTHENVQKAMVQGIHVYSHP